MNLGISPKLVSLIKNKYHTYDKQPMGNRSEKKEWNHFELQLTPNLHYRLTKNKVHNQKRTKGSERPPKVVLRQLPRKRDKTNRKRDFNTRDITKNTREHKQSRSIS